MGLFSNPKSLHPRFELPKVSPRDCSRMALPHMSSMLMPNLKWFEWQAKQGQDQTYWWTRIFNSEEYWEKNNIDIGQFAFNIAHSAAAREGLEQNKEIVEDIFINAKLGVLAGMFEKASQTTSAGDCHPVVWNAMNFFNMGVRDMEGRPQIPESSLLLRECTTWAGYALGKIPGITVEQVFARWR